MVRFSFLAGIPIVMSLLAGGPVQGRQPKPLPASLMPRSNLPITQVVFFSSGVGFFLREGEIDGHAQLDMSFPVADINDLLKSLVVQDLKGGHIGVVSYDSFDPVDKALKSFALDLTKNPGFGGLLNQARGEKVEVEWQGQTIKGTVVGVEKQKQPIKDQVVESEFLNLYTDDGLRSLPLAQAGRVRFMNTFIDGEIKRALEVLARSHDTQKRTVSLQFHGDGKRPVRVGYVIDNPIWKTSYRLVLNHKNEAYLQGWAEALEKAIVYKTKLAQTSRDIAQVQTQIKELVEDQVRLRANMERVPANSAPYQRYLKKLDEQETRIEGFQDQIRGLRRQEESQRQEYEAFLLALQVE